MAAPTISSVVPASGTVGGGTSVLIVGSGFTGANAVNFGGTAASQFAVITDTQVTATTPAGSGPVAVTITTAAGTSAATAGSVFSFTPATIPSDSSAADPAISNALASGLLTMLQSATSPDAIQAQNILLRRMALEGDLVPSRIPPPLNISQIGGYINLLTTLKQPEMRTQMLAGILGVAGSSQPAGWVSNTPPLTMVAINNDRPSGASQASVPLTVLVRSDFVSGVRSAQVAAHQLGAFLPFSGSPSILPPAGGSGANPPSDILYYCGRVLALAPAAALSNPSTDPIVLVRSQGSGGAFQIGANVLGVASTPSAPKNYDAVQCTPTTSAVTALPNAAVVLLAPLLADAGFYPMSPLPTPSNSLATSWARLQNTTGLVVGTSRLGDELALLYRADVIAGSAFATMLDATWNGTAFA
jgi:hypothetical protein